VAKVVLLHKSDVVVKQYINWKFLDLTRKWDLLTRLCWLPLTSIRRFRT